MSRISKKPMCDCGGELLIYTEEIQKLYRKINKDGRKSIRVIDTNDGDNNVYERLRCNKCSMEYWFDEDDKGRIVKDGIFNP